MTTCKFEGQEYSEGSLICSNGRELRCDSGEWKETGFACGDTTLSQSLSLLSEIVGNVVINREIEAKASVEKFSKQLSGHIYGDKPDVFTQKVRATIAKIVGINCTVNGVTKFSGEGTNIVIIEVWPSGVATGNYSGTASCNLVYSS